MPAVVPLHAMRPASAPLPALHKAKSSVILIHHGLEREVHADGSAKANSEVLSYDFGRSLFSASFFYAVIGGVMTTRIAMYCFVLIAVAVIAGLFACPATTPPQAWSVMMGAGGGCWPNSAPLTYADISLMSLASFLLALLVNSIVTKWWNTRTMLQEAINASVSAYVSLVVGMDRRTPDLDRDAAVAAFKRRLALAFRIVLLAARTDIAISPEIAREAFAEFEAPFPDGRPPLLTAAESEVLDDHRYAHVVLGWALRDAQVLCERGSLPNLRVNDLHSGLGRLRVIYNDLPMYARVQLPFSVTSFVACVVQVSLWQLVYVAASLIGQGVATPGQGIKALSGIMSIILVPPSFLCILRLQVLLSQPFGSIEAAPTNFPVRALAHELDVCLDSVDERMSEAAFERVGCLARPPLRSAS